MSIGVNVNVDLSGIAALQKGPLKAAVRRALRKAGATGLRDMRSEASKRVRARKRIKPKYVRDAITLRKPKGDDTDWALEVSADPVPLVAYPHRQGKKGVTVEVNPGKRTLVKGSFVAAMKSGHKGVFKRSGAARLPIKELFGSRPIDALLHEGEAQGVADRGGASFSETFLRVLPLEVGQ